MAAVDSARKAFPSHLARKKNGAESEHRQIEKLSSDNTCAAINGQFEDWTEEDGADVNGFLEERV